MNAEDRSASSLVGDLVHHVSELFRKEVALFRAEMSESASQATTAIGLLVAAVVFALTALNVLAAALVAALTSAGVAGGWAALIVGGAIAIIALLMAKKGADDLKASNLKPERTVDALQRDVATARETFK
jgi:p-aminobenzoyl-glutamate transporter AbgT